MESAVKPRADILDVCCGPRLFWFNRRRDDVLYMDLRRDTIHGKDGRTVEIDPDIIADFRDLPFPDGRFRMVVFDPPHLINGSPDSFINSKYGLLDRKTWKGDLRRGFAECMRVLEDGGFLIFKWSESDIPISRLASVLPCDPMFGQRVNAKTMWFVFRK